MRSGFLPAVPPLLKAFSVDVDALLPAREHLCEQADHAVQVSKVVERMDEMEYEKAAVLAASMLAPLD
jgi:hypothetical protein